MCGLLFLTHGVGAKQAPKLREQLYIKHGSFEPAVALPAPPKDVRHRLALRTQSAAAAAAAGGGGGGGFFPASLSDPVEPQGSGLTGDGFYALVPESFSEGVAAPLLSSPAPGPRLLSPPAKRGGTGGAQRRTSRVAPAAGFGASGGGGGGGSRPPVLWAGLSEKDVGEEGVENRVPGQPARVPRVRFSLPNRSPEAGRGEGASANAVPIVVLDKAVVTEQRGVPWQLYIQVRIACAWWVARGSLRECESAAVAMVVAVPAAVSVAFAVAVATAVAVDVGSVPRCCSSPHFAPAVVCVPVCVHSNLRERTYCGCVNASVPRRSRACLWRWSVGTTWCSPFSWPAATLCCR
jgi:hypothetical protein